MMNKKVELPSEVNTELGAATIGVVREENAWRVFLCPICDESILKGEEHVVLVPRVVERLRRHCHTDCVVTAVEYNYTIRLHPNDPDAISRHM